MKTETKPICLICEQNPVIIEYTEIKKGHFMKTCKFYCSDEDCVNIANSGICRPTSPEFENKFWEIEKLNDIESTKLEKEMSRYKDE